MRLILTFLLTSLGASVWAYDFAQPLKELPKTSHYSAMIYDVAKHQTVLSHQADVMMPPASTSKLLTAIAAILKLGSAFHYDTRLAITGTLKRHTLFGNVWLTFSGDPSLQLDDLLRIFQSLRRHGIHRIQGKVLLAGKPLAQQSYGPGWMWDELSACYAAPVSVFTVNENCAQFQFKQRAKHQHRFHLLPKIPGGVQVVNQVKWRKQCQQNSPVRLSYRGHDAYLWRGCSRQKKWHDSLAVRNTRRWSAAAVRLALKKSHISVSKGVQVTHRTPKQLVWQQSFASQPLSSLIRKVLKVSDNLYSSRIFLSLAGPIKLGGRWQQAAKALHQIILDWSGESVMMVDGSGLSRLNQLSSQQLVNVLLKVYKTPKLFDVIAPALAILGVDGTLKHRVVKMAKDVQIIGKTGGMTGVDTIAGYVITHKKVRYIYALMMYGDAKNRGLRLKIRDNWLMHLADQSV